MSHLSASNLIGWEGRGRKGGLSFIPPPLPPFALLFWDFRKWTEVTWFGRLRVGKRKCNERLIWSRFEVVYFCYLFVIVELRFAKWVFHCFDCFLKFKLSIFRDNLKIIHDFCLFCFCFISQFFSMFRCKISFLIQLKTCVWKSTFIQN